MMALLAVRFLAELGMLACLAIGGWQRGDELWQSIALGIGLPVLAAVIWGLWIAPRAAARLKDPGRLAVEVTLFFAAFLAVVAADPTPVMTIVGLLVWVAFLVSIPSRKHEPVPAARV